MIFSVMDRKKCRTARLKMLNQRSWGISLGKKIVIYDQGGTFLATRLFFSLYYYGYPVSDLFVLDGELSKWIEEGLPVTEEITPAPEGGTFTITRVNENAWLNSLNSCNSFR